MVVSECAGRWRFYNFERVVESLDGVADTVRERIIESLFRILEFPHSPRGLIWFEQRVGDLRGARVAQVAPQWFLTYTFHDESPAGDCMIFVYALAEVPPK